ncbi:hypothetical protein JCM11641_004064 [Rhodosporidiobolus odoratus]
MDQDSLKALADVRAQIDTKILKKTVQSFYALLSADRQGQQLQASHATFLIALDQLAQHLAKQTRLDHVTQLEVDQYRRDALALSQQSDETLLKLSSLKERLERAKQERARRIEYDALAKGIAKLPDRAKGEETLDRLSSDIAHLRQEAADYSSTWQTRKEAFGDIVGRLEGMQESIRDEKAEQTRRRALDDADGDADADPDDSTTTSPSASADDATQSKSNRHSRAATLDPNAQPFVPGGGEEASGQGEGDVEMQGVEEQGEEGGAGGREEGDGRGEKGDEGKMQTGGEEGAEEREDGEV